MLNKELLWYYKPRDKDYRWRTSEEQREKMEDIITAAAQRYHKMFGGQPNLCYIHPLDTSFLPDIGGWIGSVYVQPTEHIKLNYMRLAYEKNLGPPPPPVQKKAKLGPFVQDALCNSPITTWKQRAKGLFYADTYNGTRWFCLEIPKTVTPKRRVAMEEDLRRIANWFSQSEVTQ